MQEKNCFQATTLHRLKELYDICRVRVDDNDKAIDSDEPAIKKHKIGNLYFILKIGVWK